MNVWKLTFIKGREYPYSLYSPRGATSIQSKALAEGLLDLLNKYERMLYNSNQQADEFMLACIKKILSIKEI